MTLLNLRDMIHQEAYQQHQAQRCTQIQQHFFPEDKTFISILSMHGHDYTIAAIRIEGSRVGTNTFICTDPRSYDELTVIYTQIARVLLPFIQSYQNTDRFPVFVFPNHTSIELLRRAGEVMRRKSMPHIVRELGTFIAFLYKHAHKEGQLIVVDMIKCVDQHYVLLHSTGHIGMAKAQLRGANDMPRLIANMESEEMNAGGAEIKASDDIDLADILGPYSKAKKNNDAAAIQSISTKLNALYSPILEYQIQTMQWIVKFIQSDRLDPNNDYLEYCRQEERISFHGRSDNGGVFDQHGSIQGFHKYPQYETTTQNTLTLISRENHLQKLHFKKLQWDRYTRLEEKRRGKLIDCVVTQSNKDNQYRFQIEVSQPVVHIREGDTLHHLYTKTWSARVLSMQITPTNSRIIDLQMTKGMRNSFPQVADSLLLCKEKPFSPKISNFSRRLRLAPQTHFRRDTLHSSDLPTVQQNTLLQYLKDLK